jgi:DNA-binding NarL/FixJ family response regulator
MGVVTTTMAGADPTKPIRLAIVDDHPAIAAAISAAIGGTVGAPGGPAAPGGPTELRPPIEIVASVRTVAEALALFEEGRELPDVVLCDVQLEAGADGMRVLDAAVHAGCRVIVLTGFDRAAFGRAAFERGAAGFLSKGVEVETILDAVRTVAAGGTAFSAATLDALRSTARPPSEREIRIVAGVSRGLTSEEIGTQLGISSRTVESHLRRLFDRYGVVSRAELAVLAEREGWLAAGEVSGGKWAAGSERREVSGGE